MANHNIVVMPPEDKPQPNKFGKGQVANDAGAAGKMKARMLRYARGKSLKAIRILSEIMEDEEVSVVVRKDAAIAVMNRAWGAPKQEIEIADAGATLEEMLTSIWASRRAKLPDQAIEANSALSVGYDKVIEPSE